MYTHYFGLKERPFSLAPNPRFLFMSPRHQEALAHLLYGTGENGGFVALTGEVGTGKTTLCHCLLEQLPEEVDLALILNPRVTALELLGSLCDELRIQYPANTQSLKSLIDALNEHLLDAHARGRRTVVMIDEAQNLSFEVLEQIRLLTNLETTQTKLLHIILVGQPELNELLEQDNLRQLNQRITARYYLGPLSFGETTAYIRHRLSVSGGHASLFTTPAIRLIYRYSKGIPRTINNICDRALLGAYSHGRQKVNSAIVRKAAEEVLPKTGARRNRPRAMPWLATIAAALLAVAAATGFLRWSASNEANTTMDPPAPPPTAARNQPPVGTAKQSVGKAPKAPAAPSIAVSTKPTAQTSPEETHSGANFAELITARQRTLATAFAELLAQWPLPATTRATPDCKGAEQNGLRCLALHGDWQQLVAFNRPAVLEFDLAGNTKRYATLTAIHGDHVTLQFDGRSYRLPRDQITAFWAGNLVLLWKPPEPGLTVLGPGIRSPWVIWLREQFAGLDEPALHTTGADIFDAKLKRRVIAFQKAHHLKPDGVVGPRTFIHLNNAAMTAGIPRLDSTTP